MKLSKKGRHLMQRGPDSQHRNTAEIFSSIDVLKLHNLPTASLTEKWHVIKFCFLLIILPDEVVRQSINKSRITTSFWSDFRRLDGYLQTFNYFSDRELVNVYKYIYFYSAMRQFSSILVVKSFFYLEQQKAIYSELSLADIGKVILRFLKKLTRKNSKLLNISMLEEVTFLHYYIQYRPRNESILKKGPFRIEKSFSSNEEIICLRSQDLTCLSSRSNSSQISILIGTLPIPNLNQLIDLKINFSFFIDILSNETKTTQPDEMSLLFDNNETSNCNLDETDLIQKYIKGFKKGKLLKHYLLEFNRASRDSLIHPDFKWSREKDCTLLHAIMKNNYRAALPSNPCKPDENEFVHITPSIIKDNLVLKQEVNLERSLSYVLQRFEYLIKKPLNYKLCINN